jgi:hypothetical protein
MPRRTDERTSKNKKKKKASKKNRISKRGNWNDTGQPEEYIKEDKGEEQQRNAAGVKYEKENRRQKTKQREKKDDKQGLEYYTHVSVS